MPNPFTKVANKIVFSLQEMFNQSFDSDFNQNTSEALGYDGQSLQRQDADNLMVSVQTSGTDTYVGESAPGTALATAKWKAYKVDSSGNVTFADGDANFNNIATDLTALSYS